MHDICATCVNGELQEIVTLDIGICALMRYHFYVKHQIIDLDTESSEYDILYRTLYSTLHIVLCTEHTCLFLTLFHDVKIVISLMSTDHRCYLRKIVIFVCLLGHAIAIAKAIIQTHTRFSIRNYSLEKSTFVLSLIITYKSIFMSSSNVVTQLWFIFFCFIQFKIKSDLQWTRTRREQKWMQPLHTAKHWT